MVTETETEYHVRITELRFASSLELGRCDAFIRAFVKSSYRSNAYPFSAIAQYDPTERLWGIDLRSLEWTSPVPKAFFGLRNVESICKALVSAFRLLWMQPALGANEGGAKILVGQTLMSEEQSRAAFSILRGDILSVYRLDWPKLWPAIENRMTHDPEFWVNGFSRQVVAQAVKILRAIYPWEWVRRRYRKAGTKSSEVGMWEAMRADQGFPAYLLARTAIGCICKDPGWNYLITLAESYKLLNSFPKGSSLIKRIAKEPGHIHQANFSAYLLKRQMLVEIEPITGSGSAKHDLTARAGDVIFDIEMKALTSSEPARQVKREIAEKCKKVPFHPPRPVVVFALLVESSLVIDHKPQTEELNSITREVFEHATAVSSVVVGRMFVDSVGGPIKWSFDKFLINESAHWKMDEETLRLVFKPNWNRLAYPLLPIVFSYNLNDKAVGS